MFFKAEAQSQPAGRLGSASGIADSLYTLGNYTQAINEYAKENNINSKLQIARAYNAIGNFDKAIAQYENIIHSDKNLQIARFELGKLFFKLDDFRAANTIFYNLTSEKKENPEYFYYLGETYRGSGEEASSLVAYKKAVALDSTHLRSLFQLGKYFVVKREKLQALKFIETGLRFYENDVSLINLKALALYNDYDYKNAAPQFEKLLELGEHKPHVYEKLAYSYLELWEFERAKEAFHELSKYDASESEAYFGLGRVYSKEEQLDSARVFFKKAIEAKRPNLSKEYNALANLARRQEDLKTALKYYTLAYEEDPSNHMAFYQICTVSDQFYKDPELKLKNYEMFLEKFGNKHPFFLKIASKRISELKEEIHFAKE